MKRFTILLTIFICIFLTGCKQVVIREQIEVTAKVTEKEYKPSSMVLVPIYNPALKTITNAPHFYPAKYLVTISYEHVSNTFNDEKLFENVNQGDTIQMLLCTDHDKKGNLVEEILQFPQQQYIHLNKN